MVMFVIAFAATLTVLSITDESPEDAGFVFMVGTLDRGHALISAIVGLLAAFLVWTLAMVAADRLGDETAYDDEHDDQDSAVVEKGLP
jgi:hypothetical protein